jgi:hypothetical protein
MFKTMILVALLGGACKSKSEDATKPSAGSAASPAGDRAGFGEAQLAFTLGRKLGFVEMYEMLNKPTERAEALAKVQVIAKALGLDELAIAGKTDHADRKIAADLAAKKTQKLADTFSLGHQVSVAWFGAMLGTKIGTQVAAIETWADKAEVPAAVWRAQYDKVKAAPTSDGLEALGKALETYFKG